MTPAAAEHITSRFLSELETWRAEHPDWTEQRQREVFSPYVLWMLAGGRVGAREADGALYARLMRLAGHIVPRKAGDDGNLPCGWPARGRVSG